MSKKLKSIYKDIIKDHDLNANIPELLKIANDKYNTYAAVRLALNYYTYYEMYWDDNELWSDNLHEYISQINTMISDTILQSGGLKDAEKYITQIDDLRKATTAGMETLTIFIDLFENYEYALNRVEYRFKEMGQIEDDEEFAREILRYIFDSEDNSIVNDRIREVIGQLPIRITKQKYYDFIRDGFHELIGASEDILENLIYMIRSCASLSVSENMKEAYHRLWESKERLESISFKDITKEEYEEAFQLVQDASEFLELESKAYYGMIEIINELYTVILCLSNKELELLNNNQRDAALRIIEGTNRLFLMKKQEEASSDTLNSFEALEGVQEDMEYDLISLEDALYHIDNQHRSLVNSLGQEKLLHSLLLSKSLHSGSAFVDLNNSISEKTVDREKISKETLKLIGELEDKFKSSDRMIIRAIMANTIDKLPVFFNTHTEVMDYILYSLSKCTDLAEKYVSLEIIKALMEE